jgi:hypothetical protein
MVDDLPKDENEVDSGAVRRETRVDTEASPHELKHLLCRHELTLTATNHEHLAVRIDIEAMVSRTAT